MKTILNYFLRGLLLVFPVFATLYVIIMILGWANETFNNLLFNWLNFEIPGLGIITVFFLIVFLGFLFTRAFTKPLVKFFEGMLVKIPLIKILYTALKDLTEAFVGDRKRFNKPVLIRFNEQIDRLGFITEDDLSTLGISDRVAVYCPHSYNFSGNLYLVDPANVTPLNLNPADVMKFVVSAGVTNIEQSNTIINE